MIDIVTYPCIQKSREVWDYVEIYSLPRVTEKYSIEE